MRMIIEWPVGLTVVAKRANTNPPTTIAAVDMCSQRESMSMVFQLRAQSHPELLR